MKIIKFEPRLARLISITVVVFCLATSWFFLKWNFANVIASRMDTKLPESRPVADWLTTVAPSDPEVHFAAGRVFERTFDPADLTRSLAEYEAAAALSPNNYQAWLDLGKARNLNGDTDAALAAYARALELAPNYAAAQWIYGNALIRDGKTDEGFALIAQAAAANPEYSKPAMLTALQIFDGDIAAVRRGLGDTETTNAALAAVLGGQLHFDQAIDAWSRLAADEKTTKFKQLGETLAGQMLTAKRFRLAARVTADIQSNDAEKPMIGQVANGGFESGVKLRNAGPFEWQIADGAEPQIGLSEGQMHSGRYSLFVRFNTFETAAFRSISQTVAVEPGAEYEIIGFYKSDLKTAAEFRWEIADAMTTVRITSTMPMLPAADWTPVNATFKMPPDSDGLIIRLIREGCAGPSCPINGNISFDDLTLRRL